MSAWRYLFEAVSETVVTTVVRQAEAYLPAARRSGRIDQWCRQLGWSVDEWEGAVAVLHFNDPVEGVRKVRVSDNAPPLVTFSSYSVAAVPASEVPPDILAYLLRRNLDGSGIGMWGMYIDGNDKVTFHVLYQTLGTLDAAAFRRVCDSIVREAADFDGKLRQARLL